MNKIKKLAMRLAPVWVVVLLVACSVKVQSGVNGNIADVKQVDTIEVKSA